MTTWGGEDLLEYAERAINAQSKWHGRFLGLASQVANWSKDRRKCGAVIVRPDRTIASCGYNGFPRACDDDADIYSDRERKLSRVIHAEMNAILSCHEKPIGYTMYVWAPLACPCCDRCAAHIIQSGIKTIIYPASHYTPPGPWRTAVDEAEQMFSESGVNLYALEVKP